ncbi:MAG: DUF167 domain-containing protein [Nitrospinota bacterium]|nr:DUF167 domain-containing protein [Nitrospinota bacterium]
MPCAGQGGEGVIVAVKVSPRSSVSRVESVVAGALKVRLAAAPVDGAANAELIRTMADFFGVAKSSVTILSGESSRTKRVLIRNVTVEQANGLMAALP